MGEWASCTLGDVITLNYGKSLPEVKRNKGNIPVYSSAGLTGWHDEYLVNTGGLIIGRKGTIGKVYKSNAPFFAIDTSYYVTPNEEKYNIDYLYYLLISMGLDSLNEDSAVPGLNRDTAYSQPINLPKIPEQKAIAGVLSSLDDKIDLLHRQNKTLESMAETLFRHHFIDNAQPHWEEGVLPMEFDYTMGLSPPGSSYNDEGIGSPMFQGNADFSFRFPKNRIYTTDAKRMAQPLDTLVSVRAPVGAQNMAKEACCIGRGVATFRYKFDNSFYTYTYFKMKSLMREIEAFNDTGTVFGSISKSDFERMSIVVPPMEEAEKYEQIAKPMNDKVIANCTQINTLETLRDTLLPKLMSGEVRVKYQAEVAA